MKSNSYERGPYWIQTRWEGEKEEGFQLVSREDRAWRQVGDKASATQPSVFVFGRRLQ